MKYSFKQLKTVREQIGLTQEEMAKFLHTSQGNYSKLENDQKKIVSVEMLERIAKVLNVTFQEACDLLASQNGKTVNPEQRLRIHEQVLSGFISSSFEKHTRSYEEKPTWENLDSISKEYVMDCGIKTKRAYNSLPYPLVTGVSPENNQLAFEEMIGDMNIYSSFQFGLVSDEWLLKLWGVFLEKNEPKFIFKSKDGFTQTIRKGYEDHI